MDRVNHNLTIEITGQYLERENLALSSKILLNLSAIIVCLCLAGMHHALWESSLKKTHQVAHAPSFKITLNIFKPQPLEPVAAKKTPPEAPLKPPETPPPLPTQPSINQHKPVPKNKARPASLTAPVQNTQESTQPWSNVFDSQLRNKLQQQSSQQPQFESRPEIITYRNLDGSEEVQHNGRCFTVTEYSASPTGKKWSLPHHCKGQLTESERIARGLKHAMQARFPQETSSP